MGPVKGVLKEELFNSLRMKKGYERELSKLPKGSLVKKKIKGHDYYYLVVRKNDKVTFAYKGKIAQREVDRYKDIKQNRARYRKLLSQVNKQIRFLRKSLRGKELVCSDSQSAIFTADTRHSCSALRDQNSIPKRIF